MTNLRKELYSVDQIRAMEAALIEEQASGYELMKLAGKALFFRSDAILAGSGRVVVFCGPGNNGGDGYVAASLLQAANYSVKLFSLVDPDKLQNEAAQASADWLSAGGKIHRFNDSIPADTDLIIDALLGIGLHHPLADEFLSAVELINASPVPVLAVDISSGLDSETGQPLNTAIRAAHTVTFIGLKIGLFSGKGPHYCGEIDCAELGAEKLSRTKIQSSVERVLYSDIEQALPKRSRDSHKGDYGHVLVVGGDSGMSGAVRLAGEAAARVGAGLVSVATRTTHAAAISTDFPVLMSPGVESNNDLEILLERATVIAIGPGLGQQEWGRQCWAVVAQQHKTLVVDADALNLLAENSIRRDNWVLTPHPGEAARLLGISTGKVQADRITAVIELQDRYGGVVILKGASTLIADGSTTWLCEHGNPGMASGGMGDVLSGIVASLIAQGLELNVAARTAVWLHAVAADTAAGSAPRGLVATDLFPYLRELANP